MAGVSDAFQFNASWLGEQGESGVIFLIIFLTKIMKTNFLLITSDDIHKIGEMVEHNLNLGWQLAGPMFTYGHIICQPMQEFVQDDADREAIFYREAHRIWFDLIQRDFVPFILSQYRNNSPVCNEMQLNMIASIIQLEFQRRIQPYVKS